MENSVPSVVLTPFSLLLVRCHVFNSALRARHERRRRRRRRSVRIAHRAAAEQHRTLDLSSSHARDTCMTRGHHAQRSPFASKPVNKQAVTLRVAHVRSKASKRSDDKTCKPTPLLPRRAKSVTKSYTHCHYTHMQQMPHVWQQKKITIAAAVRWFLG